MMDRKTVCVYPYSQKEAKRIGELELWARSYAEDIACANDFSEEILMEQRMGKPDRNAARRVISEFGYDRVNRVLAATVQHGGDDERYSSGNRQWASGEMFNDMEEIEAYCVKGDPAVINRLIDQAHQEWQSLGLMDAAHCLPDSDGLNLKGRVLVLKPSALKDEYKSLSNQLVLATGGFGCSPTARGRSVYGKHLGDGENCVFQRQDFIGVLDEQQMFPWVRAKVSYEAVFHFKKNPDKSKYWKLQTPHYNPGAYKTIERVLNLDPLSNPCCHISEVTESHLLLKHLSGSTVNFYTLKDFCDTLNSFSPYEQLIFFKSIEDQNYSWTQLQDALEENARQLNKSQEQAGEEQSPGLSL